MSCPLRIASKNIKEYICEHTRIRIRVVTLIHSCWESIIFLFLIMLILCSFGPIWRMCEIYRKFKALRIIWFVCFCVDKWMSVNMTHSYKYHPYVPAACACAPIGIVRDVGRRQRHDVGRRQCSMYLYDRETVETEANDCFPFFLFFSAKYRTLTL